MVEVTEPKTEFLPVTFIPTTAHLAELREQYGPLMADTPAGYKMVVAAIAETRGLRSAVEKRRVELKRDALAWERKVNAEAKRITQELLEIEEPLKQKKLLVDEAKEKARAAAEAERREKLEQEIREQREREEARLKADREAEESRLRQQRAIEEEKLRAERVELERARAAMEAERAAEAARRKEVQDRIDAENRRIAEEQRRERECLEAERAASRKAQEAEQARLEAERRVIAAEKRRLELIEAERLEKDRLEKEAKERAERERIEEKRRRAEAEVLARSVEAARPDVQKVQEFGKLLRALEVPVVVNEMVRDFLDDVTSDIEELADRCVGYEFVRVAQGRPLDSYAGDSALVSSLVKDPHFGNGGL